MLMIGPKNIKNMWSREQKIVAVDRNIEDDEDIAVSTNEWDAVTTETPSTTPRTTSDASTQDIMRELGSRERVEESVEYFYDNMPENDDFYSIDGLKNSLGLILRLLSSWDKLQSSNEKDQKAYEQIKKVLLSIQKIVKEMLAVPLPDCSTASHVAYVTEIKKYFQQCCAEKIPPIQGIKSLLATKFYVACLDGLNTVHLFDRHAQQIDGLAQEKEKIQILLDLQSENFKKSAYADQICLTTKEFIQNVANHEARLKAEREYKMFTESEKRANSETVQQGLKKLKQDTKDLYEEIMTCPTSYLPTSNQKERESVLRDSVWLSNKEIYMMVVKDPEASKELNRFVFALSEEPELPNVNKKKPIASFEKGQSSYLTSLMNWVSPKQEKVVPNSSVSKKCSL